MKKKVLGGIIALVLVAAIAGGGAIAYFTDQGSVENNEVNTGDIDIKLKSNGSWSDDLTAVWNTPDDWAPGETYTSTLHMTNTGSIGCSHVWWNWHDPTGSEELLDTVVVVSIQEKFDNSDWGSNQVPGIEGAIGDGQAPVTLLEMIEFDGTWAFFSEDYINNDGEILGPNNQKDFSFRMKLKLPSSAGNNLQGKTATFDIDARAAQNHEPENAVGL